ncbi:Ankyrin repeat domain-containing protein 50 [Symbiodinium microadriaticum]|uniref:Ankyrin repeat domain-containing protein 50 n=1 Tax=Symbiodinium microadriaticum TaxID=2951 RepID=A0A1Q9E0F5_SYMMI|nr:Ankyrin repeat domain-containing protein 50 [Symbiodinium microadriaticum]
MLRLWTLSGESITCPVEELEDVKALKRLLHDLHQFPPRFRQRILIDGRNLDDSAKLDPSVDATVVLQALQQPSQSEADSLAAAAECGSLSKVEAILQLPQDPDAPDRSGGRPIFIASLHGHIETVRLLLEAKADKDSVDHNGATALMGACCRGHLEVARLLLEAGVDKDAAGVDDGITALMLAALGGHTEVLQLLIEASVDIDTRDNRGDTSLMHAAIRGHFDAACVLLGAGCSIDACNGNGHTALLNASVTGHKDVVRLLLELRADLEVVDVEGMTALTSAALTGQLEVVALLLEAGADKNSTTANGHSALMRAAVKGQTDMVRLLVEASADKDTVDDGGCTALHFAANYGHKEIAALLLKGGADMNAANNEGNTPLMRAISIGHFSIVRVLLQARADMDARNKSGCTPLMLASLVGDYKAAYYLLEAGASKNLTRDDGATALFIASLQGSAAVVQVLLNAGVDTDIALKNGLTALMIACSEGQILIATLLLEAGADKDAVDDKGFTALDIASWHGHAEAVRLLSEASADPKPVSRAVGALSMRAPGPSSDQEIFWQMAAMCGAGFCIVALLAIPLYSRLRRPSYMSPERHLGDDYSYPSDVWSVGVAVFSAFALKQALWQALCEESEPLTSAPSVNGSSLNGVDVEAELPFERHSQPALADVSDTSGDLWELVVQEALQDARWARVLQVDLLRKGGKGWDLTRRTWLEPASVCVEVLEQGWYLLDQEKERNRIHFGCPEKVAIEPDDQDYWMEQSTGSDIAERRDEVQLDLTADEQPDSVTQLIGWDVSRGEEPPTVFEEADLAAYLEAVDLQFIYLEDLVEVKKVDDSFYTPDVEALLSNLEAEKAYDWIRLQWKCTPLQRAEEGHPVTFLGVDVHVGRDEGGNYGFLLCQSGYIQELLRCYSIVPKQRAAPVPKEWFKDVPETESYSQEELRAAQKVTGELLWVTQRSRVDLAYAVAVMGSWTVKAPRVVKKIGMRLLEYLGVTCDYRLSLIPGADAYNGVTVFSDASFAPYGCNSDPRAHPAALCDLVAHCLCRSPLERASAPSLVGHEFLSHLTQGDGLAPERQVFAAWLHTIP